MLEYVSIAYPLVLGLYIEPLDIEGADELGVMELTFSTALPFPPSFTISPLVSVTGLASLGVTELYDAIAYPLVVGLTALSAVSETGLAFDGVMLDGDGTEAAPAS